MSTTLPANGRHSVISRALPQEILDDITDIAAGICFESLLSLSLSSRRFVERSQRHIFREIKISRERHVSQLLALLDGKPQLARHARFLWLCIDEELCDFQRVLKDVSRVAGQLFGLKRLRLEAGLGLRRNEHNPFCRWHLRQLASVCNAFLRNLASLAIEEVGIDAYIDFTVNPIRRLPISTLKVGPSDPTSLTNHKELQDEEGEIVTTGWKIRHFECDRNSSAALFLVGICSTSVYQTLVVLDFKIEFLPQHEAAWSLIGALKDSPALEVLVLCYYCWHDYSGVSHSLLERRPLPNLPSLLCLRLIEHTRGYRTSGITARVLPSFVTAFFAAIVSGNPRTSLEVVDIKHLISDIENTEEYEAILKCIPFNANYRSFRGMTWRGTDDLLTDNCLLPRLRALRINFGCIDDPAKMKEYGEICQAIRRRCGAEVRALLPKSVERVPLVDFGVGLDETSEFSAVSNIYHTSSPILATW
ncbi:hypothetical protein D9611_008383 [Ephemerocybe angulata]|uniref:Uncharacterized protein n=1 Tax=Ephemerocybe angulata TaxID=980116 RepID=A0A8H5F5H7_9AGAR|nr:hypothetical protein D9611_008383 [Tulosesus angulatus]